MSKVQILDLGGSIVAPEQVDSAFVKEFKSFLTNWLNGDSERKAVLIIGGGAPARNYQKAYREIVEYPVNEEQDWIGIMATRLNAQILRAVFSDYCPDEVVTDPTVFETMSGQVLVAAGWKPGFSTDYDAVLLAEKLGAETILNLSNIKKVYSADPKKDPNAVPLDKISWNEYKKMCGDEWTPGFNIPFDPVATKKAAELGLKVIAADGRDLENLKNIFDGKDFVGTEIG